MARTVVSSKCVCTSATIGWAVSGATITASSIGGSRAALKATSSTAPRTAITRPSIVALDIR
jgi:hypothetical protein